MVKNDNSLRSKGLTVIATDKPTRAALKALAAADGLTLSDYLRKIASQGKPAMFNTSGLGGTGKGVLSPGNNQLTEAIETNFKYMFAAMYDVAGGEEFTRALSLPVNAFYKWVRSKRSVEVGDGVQQGKMKIA